MQKYALLIQRSIQSVGTLKVLYTSTPGRPIYTSTPGRPIYTSTPGRPIHSDTNSKCFTLQPLADLFIPTQTQRALHFNPWQTYSFRHKLKGLYTSTPGRPIHSDTNSKGFTLQPLADLFTLQPLADLFTLQPLADLFIPTQTQPP